MSILLHEHVLDFVLDYRARHPDFTCWLRHRNTSGKLDKGCWFQGNDNYAFVGLYKAPGGTNMTRSIGLVFWYDTDDDKTMGVHLEVGYNEERDIKRLAFYEDLVKAFPALQQEHGTKYKWYIGYGSETFDKARWFLDEVKPQMDELVKKHRLTDILITKEDFEYQLDNILSRRNALLKTSVMDYAKLEEFKRLYREFKSTESYRERTEQYAIVPVFKDIIAETLKNKKLTNEHLTGFIQIFKYGVSDSTFDHYLDQNIPDRKKLAELSERAYEVNQYGYTGAGLNSVDLMPVKDLETIKQFLTDAFEVETIEDAVTLTTEYDKNNIAYVKSGVYSPWLYYINPQIFPIKNTTHKKFLQWMGIPEDYPTCIYAFHELMKAVDENELGPLDMFAYTFDPVTTAITSETTNPTNYMKHPLNTILYGPPGTGKTYHTINRAIEIANPEFGFTGKTRKQVKEEYDRLVGLGRIDFCTFHQSMSYEDFVEGIKPVLTNSGKTDKTDSGTKETSLKYELIDGIFKRMAENASFKPTKETLGFSLPESEYDKAVFYKMSLGSTLDPDDDDIYRYCMDNNYIALGWGGDVDYTGKNEAEVMELARDNGLEKYDGQSINYFMHYLKSGNYVVISKGNYAFRAIGKVTGEYEYKPDSPIRYNHFRKVQWLLKEEDIPVEQLYTRSFSQQSVYKLDKTAIKKEFFVKVSNTHSMSTTHKPGNYVLIIDEINRGNISQIFGELITLIEDDKREGREEAISVTLPYSKEKFSVPANLYIVGTMNTADRSVEALDAALRRRFSFKFKGPDYTTLQEDGTDKKVGDISLKLLLETINTRITYLLDEDHQIGHSYFMKVGTIEELRDSFDKAIIPLLKEYFYNDHEKILWILGKGFVIQKDTAPAFASGIKEDLSKQSYDFIKMDDNAVFSSAIHQLLNLHA